MTVYYFPDEPWEPEMPFQYSFFETYAAYLLRIVPVALLAGVFRRVFPKAARAAAGAALQPKK